MPKFIVHGGAALSGPVRGRPHPLEVRQGPGGLRLLQVQARVLGGGGTRGAQLGHGLERLAALTRADLGVSPDLVSRLSELAIEDPTPVQAAAIPPLRVLLTDDNAFNQKVGTLKLEKYGHTVVVAGSGREAPPLSRRSDPDVLRHLFDERHGPPPIPPAGCERPQRDRPLP